MKDRLARMTDNFFVALGKKGPQGDAWRRSTECLHYHFLSTLQKKLLAVGYAGLYNHTYLRATCRVWAPVQPAALEKINSLFATVQEQMPGLVLEIESLHSSQSLSHFFLKLWGSCFQHRQSGDRSYLYMVRVKASATVWQNWLALAAQKKEMFQLQQASQHCQAASPSLAKVKTL